MKEKLSILQHALGVDQYGQGRQYRNHFVTGPGSRDYDVCRQLVADELMINRGASAMTGGDDCFVVTPAGVDFVALNSPAPPPPKKLTRSQRNYQRYLDLDCGFSFAEWMGFGPQRSRKRAG